MIQEDSKFEKITNDNIIFQKFCTKLIKELNNIHKNFPDFEIRDYPVKENSYYIISPNFLQQFIQLDKIDEKKEIFSLLIKLLNLSAINLELTISLDHSSLSLELGNIYYNLIEKTFPFYFYHNSSIDEQILRYINEWRENFSGNTINIEILIPLKGFFFPKEEFSNNNNIIFINEENALEISLKLIPEYKYTSLERKYSNISKYGIKHIKGSKALYCISAKGQIPFYSFPNGEYVSEFNYLGDYIKQIAQVISLEGTLLRFGKPFYRFPWWISKIVISSFNFLIPDWMNQRYMNNNQEFKLIPDQFSISIPFSDKENSDEKTKFHNLKQPTRIFGFSQSQLNPGWELFSDCLEIERSIEKSEPGNYSTYKISDPNVINILFKKLSNTSSQINFESNNFILERLLKIGQRDHIEDAILDSSLILESIFLGKGNNTELSYRLKLYVSSLLASNLDQFEKEFEYFNMVYGIRSQIIHSTANWKKSSKGKSKYESFIEKCYPKFIPILESNEHPIHYKLDNLIQFELFKKIGETIKIILEKNINFPSDFEKGGFFKIFLDSNN